MFHEKWKGRIENNGNQEGSKEGDQEGREEEKALTFAVTNRRGRESVPFAFVPKSRDIHPGQLATPDNRHPEQRDGSVICLHPRAFTSAR